MGILDKIISAKEDSLLKEKASIPLEELIKSKPEHETIFPLEKILTKKNILISEMKRQSPSGGNLDQTLIPKDQAEMYINAGSDAISVLTEKDYFMGSEKDLSEVLEITKNKQVPVLQKDFIIDEYQIYNAKKLGADCILLITRILSMEKYLEFYELSKSLGLSAIVEIFDESELDFALKADINIIGINNRNLKTLKTDIKTTYDLHNMLVGHSGPIVCESGIKSEKEVEEIVKKTKINNFLIGESLLKDLDQNSPLLKKITQIRP